MAFKIDFKFGKPARAANINVHDEAVWGFAHEWAEKTASVNQWPRQYAVHYIYEFVNRPWLSDRANLEELVTWVYRHPPSQLIRL